MTGNSAATPAAKVAKTRIYQIRDTATGAVVRLIRGRSPLHAAGHYSRQSFTCALASQDDLIAATKSGVPCEDAVDPADDMMGARSANMPAA